MSRYRGLFLEEAREHLEAASEHAATLREDPRDPEALRRLFHHAHSLKGMSATMGYPAMVELSHGLEDLLDRVRDGDARGGPGRSCLIAEAFGCLERMLVRLERDGTAEDPEATELVQRMRSADEGSGAAPAAPAPVAGRVPRAVPERQDGEPARHHVELALAGEPALGARDFSALIAGVAALGRVVHVTPPGITLGDREAQAGRLALILETALPAEELEARLTRRREVAGATVRPAPARLAEGEQRPRKWVRVRADLLDSLLENTLELLVERARAARRLTRDGSPAERLDRLELLLRRIHGDLVEIRLQPFEPVAERLSRAVADLAPQLGKRVRLSLEGRHVRIDRSVLEALVDPLLHLLRNALDHGIETPDERSRAGKPAQGRLTVRLARQGDRVAIVVEDDGRGLRAEELRRQAVERGLIDPGEARALDDAGALMLITLPGFSTAAAATAISGRGVGMDFVRDRVESLGGHLEVEARPGSGTRVRISLPLTLALVQALMVRSSGELFAVPVAMVSRTVALRAGPPERRAGRPVLIEGGTTVELVGLAERLGGAAPPDAARPASALLVEAAGGTRGIVVEEVLGRKDVVVRPLGAPLDRLREFVGAALLEDGSVTLVVDPVQLAG